ncbi:MAG: hypothetical protein ABI886_00435 [Betaproteobacteria bacterium]
MSNIFSCDPFTEAGLDEKASVAKYGDGVLELKLVRKASAAGRKLPVM